MSDSISAADVRERIGMEGRSFKLDLWRSFWETLTAPQQEWIKHKCNWEHMTRSAVAAEWGVPSTEQCR